MAIGWLALITDLLKGAASGTALLDRFRARDSRPQSPFAVVPIQDLHTRVTSPLRVTPEKVQRRIQMEAAPGLTIILGTSGVGKTRAAVDLTRDLVKVSGANCLYFARGYVAPSAPLPLSEEVRRSVVFIDDYDWGFPPAASTSFLDRQSAYVEAIMNLDRLYKGLSAVRELYGMLVTVNTHRLPCSADTIDSVLPECRTYSIPPVTPEEYGHFAVAIGSSLGLCLSAEAVTDLVAACDGRLDSLATFLQTFPTGHTVAKDDIGDFTRFQRMAWEIFRRQLSADQRWAYNQAKLLTDYGLRPHFDYLRALSRQDAARRPAGGVESVIASIWPVADRQPLIYDGQLGPPDRSPEAADSVVRAVLRISRKRRRDRYAFQDEMRTLGIHLQSLSRKTNAIRLMKRLTRWYPRDRFFAYLLAIFYAQGRHYFRAILALYRVFRHPDPLAFYSGKWVEIHSHLLLAKIYQAAKSHEGDAWRMHQKVEHEFAVCAMLADIQTPDIGVDGYKVVASRSSEKEAKERLRHYLKELGYEVPSKVKVDSRALRAVIHHEYSSYLLGQTHREYDAIRHEEIVSELVPEFGEALLNCATACLQIGNSASALEFLERAQQSGPQQMDRVMFDFMVSREHWRCFQDIGNIDEAKKWFSHCMDMTGVPPLSADAPLRAKLLAIADDPAYWTPAAKLAHARDKHFSNEAVTYCIHPLGIEIVLPHDWKIDKEGMVGEDKIEELGAVFSSQVKWSDDTRSPIDASVALAYTSRPEDVAMTGEAFGISQLKQVNKALRNRVFWSPTATARSLGRATEYRWSFEVKGPWPKVGFLLVYDLSGARISLNMMCEKCGGPEFWPVLFSVAETFSRQRYLSGRERTSPLIRASSVGSTSVFSAPTVPLSAPIPIVETADASAEQRALTFVNRGALRARFGDWEEGLADCTAAIEMPDVPAEQKALALVNRAVLHGKLGDWHAALADCSSVIEMPNAPAEQRARALVERGAIHGERGKPEGAVADSTAVIEMPDVASEQKAQALVNRGMSRLQLGDLERAHGDLTAVIEMVGAPVEQKAKAFFCRIGIYEKRGDSEKSLADCTAVTGMPDATAEQRARAIACRGAIYAKRGDLARASADLTTVIETFDAPIDWKTQALLSRAEIYERQGDLENRVADLSAVVEMPEAPAEDRAEALVRRGLDHWGRGEREKAIADLTLLLQIPDVPTKLRAGALINRGAIYGKSGDPGSAIADFTAVVEMPDASAQEKAFAYANRGSSHARAGRCSDAIEDLRNAASLDPSIGFVRRHLAKALLANGQANDALAAYDSALQLATPNDLAEMAADLDGTLKEHGPLPGSEEVMARIESRRTELQRASERVPDIGQ